MAKVISSIKKKEKPQWSPDKNYKWDPEDVFEFTGLQMAAIFHCVNNEVNVPAGASVIQKMEAFNAIMDVFKLAVEQGVIVETDSMKEEFVEKDQADLEELFKK